MTDVTNVRYGDAPGVHKRVEPGSKPCRAVQRIDPSVEVRVTDKPVTCKWCLGSVGPNKPGRLVGAAAQAKILREARKATEILAATMPAAPVPQPQGPQYSAVLWGVVRELSKLATMMENDGL